MSAVNGLPPDPDEQNGDRARWAHAALVKFRMETGTDQEDALSDLLCDLRHWADRNGHDWDAELRRGDMHYTAETSAEGEWP